MGLCSLIFPHASSRCSAFILLLSTERQSSWDLMVTAKLHSDWKQPCVKTMWGAALVGECCLRYRWGNGMWSSKSSLSNGLKCFKAYQTPLFTTLESYHSSGYLIFSRDNHKVTGQVSVLHHVTAKVEPGSTFLPESTELLLFKWMRGLRFF